MWLVIFNALLYFILLLIYWKKKHKIDCGFILLSLYAFVGIMCVFEYATEPYQWKLIVWPFIYLFLIFLLFSWPVLKYSDKLYDSLIVKNTLVLKIISDIYIVASIIVVYFYLPKAINNINSGAWLINYKEITSGAVLMYGSQLERIVLNIVTYLNVAAIVIMFYSFVSKKISSVRTVSLFIAVIASTILINVVKSSRGMLLIFMFTLLGTFLIFKDGIPKRIKKVLFIFSIISSIIILIYVLAVTVSRFGVDQQSSSIWFYFGHSFLTFDYGIADTTHSYANGDIFFSWLNDLLSGTKTNFIDLGAHSGTNFTTFVGSLYLDFGPRGTFLIALIFPLMISLLFRGKNYVSLANIYMFMYYLKYLMVGVFVIGSGEALQWLIAFIIYGLLNTVKIKRINDRFEDSQI